MRQLLAAVLACALVVPMLAAATGLVEPAQPAAVVPRLVVLGRTIFRLLPRGMPLHDRGSLPAPLTATQPTGSIQTPQLADGAVTDPKLRDSAARSVIGRAAATVGDPGDIVAASDGQVLRRSGGTLGFASLTDSEVAAANKDGVAATPSLRTLADGVTLGAQKALGGIVGSGTDASKPAAGTVGRVWIATDTRRIYRDDGAAWVEVARFAGNIGAADLGFDPATQAELDTHAALSGLGGHVPAGGLTDAHVVAANKDGADGTPSMRTLGTGAAQAAKGSHSHTLAGDVTGDLGTVVIATGKRAYHLAGGATSTTNNQTEYFHLLGLRAPAAAEDAIYRLYFSRATTLRNLRAVLGVNFAGPNTVSVTLRKNGVDQALSITFNGGSAGDVASDNDSFSVAAGEYVTVKTVNNGAGSGVSIGWSVEAEQ